MRTEQRPKKENIIEDTQEEDESTSGSKVSVVTVVYNGVDDLEKTIRSVIGQDYRNSEYVIIDGGSTDGTLDIIQKYENYIDRWISEPDQGIYDAMNKGLLLAEGDWVNFLNAGDLFLNDKVISTLLGNVESNINMLYGSCIVEDQQHQVYLKAKKFNRQNLIFWGTRTLCHQAILIKKSIAPFYCDEFIYKGELHWYFNILENIKTEEVKYINIPVVIYQTGGVGEINLRENLKEQLSVLWYKSGILFILGLPVMLYRYFKNKV